MIILFRPGLENNLVANAVIKLNVTVAELLLVWFLTCLIAMSRNQKKKKKKKIWMPWSILMLRKSWMIDK